MNKQIEVYNLGGLPTAPIDSFLELQEDFKISDPDKLAKLQMLIITRGFKYAFKAWRLILSMWPAQLTDIKLCSRNSL